MADVADRVCAAENLAERINISLQCTAVTDLKVDFPEGDCQRGFLASLVCQTKSIKTPSMDVVKMVGNLLQHFKWQTIEFLPGTIHCADASRFTEMGQSFVWILLR